MKDMCWNLHDKRIISKTSPLFGEIILSSGDPEFDDAMESLNYIQFANPRTWSDTYDDLDDITRAVYFKLWGK